MDLMPISVVDNRAARHTVGVAVRHLFGTDGVRGRANIEPVTAETMLRLAMATAAEFGSGSRRHLVIVGKDTRLSGYTLEPALTAGFVSMGMDVALAGAVPTPAVALLTRSMRADLGVMISASHNHSEDNGIKLFGPNGRMVSDTIEQSIERHMASARNVLPVFSACGHTTQLTDAAGRYIEFVKRMFGNKLHLAGLRVVIDCAHGAAYKIAPTVLYELGADVIPIGIQPDGLNINHECGAMFPATLCDAVRANRADIGIAVDGDADRVIMCDETGGIMDGDQLLALLATEWHTTGRLKGRGIVATVMSNLGLERYLRSSGLQLYRTPIGERYLLAGMDEHACNMGGEQSGRLILGDLATTGDGIASALHVLASILRRGCRASDVARLFSPLPQLTKSVSVQSEAVLETRTVGAFIQAARGRLGDNGRILVRKSGTEPAVRVMAEAEDAELVSTIVAEACDAVAHADTGLLLSAR
jgi:phosphoglucosamine mutase